MVQNALNDFRPDPLLLVGLVHNDIPDSGSIREIRQHAAEADELIAIPRAKRQVSVPQHLLRVFKRAIFCPGRLVEQPHELGRFHFLLFGKRDRSLEGGGHLVLE